MNPLNNSTSARRVAYLIQWVVNGVLGVTGVVLTAQGHSPQWFIITTAAFNFVWSYTGLTAQSNVVDPANVNEIPDDPAAGF